MKIKISRKILLKNVVLCIFISGFCSCTEDFAYNDTFKNTTNYNVNVSPNPKFMNGQSSWSMYLKPGETKTHSSSDIYFIFKITSSDATQKNFDSKLINDVNIINCFNYKITYKISGSAKQANLTFNNSNGTTGQINGAYLPCTINYNEFEDDFLYISAQNYTDNGSVYVQIYYEDVLIKSAFADGAYEIATTYK